MDKFLLRVTALLLVPCLLADPSSAAAWAGPFASSLISTPVRTDLFAGQAIPAIELSPLHLERLHAQSGHIDLNFSGLIQNSPLMQEKRQGWRSARGEGTLGLLFAINLSGAALLGGLWIGTTILATAASCGGLTLLLRWMKRNQLSEALLYPFTATDIQITRDHFTVIKTHFKDLEKLIDQVAPRNPSQIPNTETTRAVLDRVQSLSLSKTLSLLLGTPYPAQGINPFSHMDNNLRSRIVNRLEVVEAAKKRGFTEEAILEHLEQLRKDKEHFRKVRLHFKHIKQAKRDPLPPPLALIERPARTHSLVDSSIHSILLPFLTFWTLSHYFVPASTGDVQMASLGGLWGMSWLIKRLMPFKSPDDSPGMDAPAPYVPQTLAGKICAATPIEAAILHIEFLIAHGFYVPAGRIAAALENSLSLKDGRSIRENLIKWTTYYPESKSIAGYSLRRSLLIKVSVLKNWTTRRASQQEYTSAKDKLSKMFTPPRGTGTKYIELKIPFTGHYRPKPVTVRIVRPATPRQIFSHVREHFNENPPPSELNWSLRINGLPMELNAQQEIASTDRVEIFFMPPIYPQLGLTLLENVKDDIPHGYGQTLGPVLYKKLRKGAVVGRISSKELLKVLDELENVTALDVRNKNHVVIIHDDVPVSGGPLALRLLPGTEDSPVITFEIHTEAAMSTELIKEAADRNTLKTQEDSTLAQLDRMFALGDSPIKSLLLPFAGATLAALSYHFSPAQGSVLEASLGSFIGFGLLTSFLGRFIQPHAPSESLSHLLRTAA